MSLKSNTKMQFKKGLANVLIAAAESGVLEVEFYPLNKEDQFKNKQVDSTLN